MDTEDQREANRRSFLHPVYLREFGRILLKAVAVIAVGWGVFAFVTYAFEERPALREGKAIAKRIEDFQRANHRLPTSLADLDYPPSNRWFYMRRTDENFDIYTYAGGSGASLCYSSRVSSDSSHWCWQTDNGDIKWISE